MSHCNLGHLLVLINANIMVRFPPVVAVMLLQSASQYFSMFKGNCNWNVNERLTFSKINGFQMANFTKDVPSLLVCTPFIKIRYHILFYDRDLSFWQCKFFTILESVFIFYVF